MNPVCQRLGIQYPIIEGGLAYVGNGLLAAAVSEGGGLGQIGSGGRTPDDFRREIALAVEQTELPLGVNIPLSEHHDSTPYLRVVEDFKDRLMAVSLSAGNPRPYIPILQGLGLRVMTLASTAAQAKKAEQAGADLIVCEGMEAGGHNGPAEIGTMVLVASVKKVVSIPIIAAGGIADGPTAVAVMGLGAHGIQMGTRFVATIECQAHEHYKQALVQRTAQDTVVMERSLGRATRVLKSEFVQKILQQEQATPGSLEKLLPLIAGQHNYTAAVEGHLEAGFVNCGQSVESIQEVLPAAEVVAQIGSAIASYLE